MLPIATVGEVMRLNGSVPRGADLRTAIPKRCKTCGALFILFGKGSTSALYCPECRAKKCPSCNGAGGTHYASCGLLRARPCRGCGVELGHGPGSHSPYCEECRAHQCPECRTYGGRHGAACLYERRQRRPGLTEPHGLVTEAHIVAIYVQHRAQAVQTAQRIVGADAEDVVHDVTLYLLEKRDFLTDIPGQAYFLTAVRNGALRVLVYAWHRYVVAMDPEDLLIAEQMMARGEPDHLVRLPAPVA